MSIKDFLKECQKREVFKLLSIYIVSSWVILQVLAIIWKPLGLPEKIITYLIIALLVGFPIYTYILWKMRFRFAKSKSEDQESIEDNIKREISFKTKYFTAFGIIGLFSILSVFFIINNNFLQKISLPQLVESDKIAVLNFDNNTGDRSLDIIGKMTADWLIHGITENRAGEVITSEVVSSYTDLLGVQATPKENTNILSRFLKPNKVISGEFFLKDSTLVLQCSIKNSSGSETLYAFAPIECDVDDSLACIENLRQEVVGFLITELEDGAKLEESPPKFEAYEKFLDAKSNYDDPDRYERLLNEAIEIDSNYFEPKVLMVQHHYNQGEYKISDSLNKSIASNKRLSKRQQHVLNFCKALIDGKNDKIVRNWKYEYDISPNDLPSNSTYMTLLVQFINRPELVEEIYNVETMEDMIIENRPFCGYRYFVMGLAFNEIGDYQKTIDLLEPLLDTFESNDIDRDIKRTLISAYINSDQLEPLNALLSKFELTEPNSDIINDINIFVGNRFEIIGKSSTASNYFNTVISSESTIDIDLGHAYFYSKAFEKALLIYKELLKDEPNSESIISKLAVCYNKNGQTKKAADIISTLESLREEYEYGNVDYAYAQYYVSINQNKEVISYLLKSIAKGNLYTPTTFQNDVLFKDIKDLPEFQQILKFWQ